MNSVADHITVHIERLILDGLTLSRLEGQTLQRALETELARLLSAYGIADELRSGAALATIRTATIELSGVRSPAQIGCHIAQTVHASLAQPSAQASAIGYAQHDTATATAAIPQGART